MEAFKKEAASLATGPEAPPFSGSEERAVFEDVLLYNVADGDPERYVNEFGTLAAWADSSLDMYKVRVRQRPAQPVPCISCQSKLRM